MLDTTNTTKYKVCDICLDRKDCKKINKCDCSTCKLYDECPKKLRAVVRITLKCTQKCGHCCFASGQLRKLT